MQQLYIESDNEKLIRKFLDKELSEEEMELFRTKFREEEGFADEVRTQSDIVVTLRAARHEQVKGAAPKKSTKRRTLRPMRFLVAASAAILIAGGTFFVFVLNEPAQKELIAEEFINKRLQNLRGDSGSTDVDPLNKVYQLYIGGEKEKAITFMREITEVAPDRAEFFFILGDMYFENAVADSAAVVYQKGLNIEANDPYAKWNLALAYLDTGRQDKAEEILQAFIDSESPPYDEKAEKLLKKLHSITFRLKN